MSENEKLQNRCLGLIMGAIVTLASEANPEHAAKLIELMNPLVEKLAQAEKEEPK